MDDASLAGVIEASQSLEIAFTQPLSASQFAATLTCDGKPVAFAPTMLGQDTVVITAMQKPPASSCTLAITSPVAKAIDFRVEPAPVPAPLRVVTKHEEPYRYGVLEHPFPFSLADAQCSKYGCAPGSTVTFRSDSLAQYSHICASGVGYVRIDYPMALIETVNGKVNLPEPNFTVEDAIVDKLHECDVTELPAILQYDVGPVNAGGRGQSAMAVSPDVYAKFARDVATHLKQFPWITHVELMNEPNDHGWGTCPTGPPDNPWASSDESGACVAAYLLAGYKAVKEANPKLTVVAPALSDGGHSTDFRPFVRTLLMHGCKTGACWDVMDIHNYAWFNPRFEPANAEGEWNDYKQLEKLVPNTPVMLTEAGWCQSDVNFGNQWCSSEAAAAQYYAIASNMMLADPTVIGVTWVGLYDTPQIGYKPNFWSETSFFREDGTPKLAYHALCTFTGACK